MPELKQFVRAGKQWISSVSTTPLHYLAIEHDVGRWGTYLDFFEIPAGSCPLPLLSRIYYFVTNRP